MYKKREIVLRVLAIAIPLTWVVAGLQNVSSGAGWGIAFAVAFFGAPIVAFLLAGYLGKSKPVIWAATAFVFPIVVLPVLAFSGARKKPSTTYASGHPRVECYMCGKSLSEISGGIYSGGAIASAVLTSPYPCKSCGTVFCVDCMSKMTKSDRICPACNHDVGW